MKNDREYLERELQKAQEKFEETKKAAAKEIENMSVYMAEDFGAAYASHIDKVTAAAAKIRVIEDALHTYDYFQNK